MKPTALDRPRQLLAEGRAAKVCLEALLRTMGRTDSQVQDFGGIGELRAFLKALVRSPGFRQVVTHVLVLRDAERSPADAFQSVCGAFAAAQLPVPEECAVLTSGRLRSGVFLFPGQGCPGMIEDLFLECVSTDPAIACVDEFIDCVQRRTGVRPTPEQKARVQAFLASRERPGLLLGEAAAKGYWPWETEPMRKLREFLKT